MPADLKTVSKKLAQVNPNLLIGGAIVGLVGLGGVLLWRVLDPRNIPEKVRTEIDEHYEKYYTTTDPETQETKPDTKAILLSTFSPAFGVYNYLKKSGVWS